MGVRGLGGGFWEDAQPINRGREGRGEAGSEERGMMSLASLFALNLSFPAQTLRQAAKQRGKRSLWC